MVEIKKAEQSRCCNCCSSKQDVYNVTFWKDGTNSGTQVALCKKCMDEFGKLARLIEPEDDKNGGDSDDLISRQAAIDAALTLIVEYCGAAFDEDMQKMLCERLGDLPSAEPERTAKVTLLNTGLHSVWGTCKCGRQVEKPGRNDQSGAYYCPRCGAKLEWE